MALLLNAFKLSHLPYVSKQFRKFDLNFNVFRFGILEKLKYYSELLNSLIK